MRGGIPIQGDHPRGSMLFRRPGKEPLSGGHITPFAQEKVDGSTLPIDRAIAVDPLATNLNISLVYAPGIADRPRITAPALLKFRDIPTAKWSYGPRRCRARPSFGRDARNCQCSKAVTGLVNWPLFHTNLTRYRP